MKNIISKNKGKKFMIHKFQNIKKLWFFTMFWGDLEGAGTLCPPPVSSYIQKPRTIRVNEKLAFTIWKYSWINVIPLSEELMQPQIFEEVHLLKSYYLQSIEHRIMNLVHKTVLSSSKPNQIVWFGLTLKSKVHHPHKTFLK